MYETGHRDTLDGQSSSAQRGAPTQRNNSATSTAAHRHNPGSLAVAERNSPKPRDLLDLACAPGFPGPASGHTYLPSRFCSHCAIESSEATCFLCGKETAATMPRGWY